MYMCKNTDRNKIQQTGIFWGGEISIGKGIKKALFIIFYS